MLFDTLLLTYAPFRNIIKAHASTFHYDTTFVLSGDEKAMTATFGSRPRGEDREFRFTLIDSLGHDYPNTVNHPFRGARLHWEWMRQFMLE
jgi:hypothetical protein